MTKQERIKEINRELAEMESDWNSDRDPCTGYRDDVASSVQSTHWGELEGEKRGLEAK